MHQIQLTNSSTTPSINAATAEEENSMQCNQRATAHKSMPSLLLPNATAATKRNEQLEIPPPSPAEPIAIHALLAPRRTMRNRKKRRRRKRREKERDRKRKERKEKKKTPSRYCPRLTLPTLHLAGLQPLPPIDNGQDYYRRKAPMISSLLQNWWSMSPW